MEKKSKIIKRDQVEQDVSLLEQLDMSSSRHSGTAKKVLSPHEMKALQETQVILKNAQTEAEEIKDKARKILLAVEVHRDQAKKQGFDKGHEEGLASVTEFIIRYQKNQDDFVEKFKSEAVALIYQIAEKMIGDTLKNSDEALLKMVQKVTQSSTGTKLLILLNPEDHERVKQNESRVATLFADVQSLQWRASDAVKPGGCIVESELGTVEAQLDTQLAAIKKALGLSE
jgi:type III secretion protein L